MERSIEIISKNYPLILALLGIKFLVVAAFLSIWRERKKQYAIWEEEEKQNPIDFMADDEWCFVEYKDGIFPMKVIEKRERWDTWTGRERREFYLTMQTAIKKGRIRKVIAKDGKTMYVKTHAGENYIINKYNKLREEYERTHGARSKAAAVRSKKSKKERGKADGSNTTQGRPD